MKNSDDLAKLQVTAKEACRAIGISEATLYAYVSRGLVRAVVDPEDGRRSLYDHRDIAALAARQRRPRARRDVAASTLDWGEPSLLSSISTIVKGKLRYRDQDAIELSRTASFEDISKLLCGVAPSDTCAELAYSTDCDGIDRMLMAMAQLGTSSDNYLAHDVSDILRVVIDAACGSRLQDGECVEKQLARALSIPEEATDILRRTLVLCADHELNPSAFAARIATSTAASLPAALIAALATFSGGKHGRLPVVCRDWLERRLSGRSFEALPESPPPPGFGHRLYPDADPRCKELMRVLPLSGEIVRLAHEITETTGLHPNIDFALASFEISFDLKPGTSSTLFATGRTCGWIAHSLEQKEQGHSIRPRAYEFEKADGPS